MLTDDAKQHSSEDRLEAFFSSGADAAYEIARGKKIKAGRYAFPVTLFPFHSGTTGVQTGRRNPRSSWFGLAKTSGQSIDFPSSRFEAEPSATQRRRSRRKTSRESTMKRIHKVAVLGAGTMGARIAAHFANAGVPSYLLDIVPAGCGRPGTQQNRRRRTGSGEEIQARRFLRTGTGPPGHRRQLRRRSQAT